MSQIGINLFTLARKTIFVSILGVLAWTSVPECILTNFTKSLAEQRHAKTGPLSKHITFSGDTGKFPMDTP